MTSLDRPLTFPTSTRFDGHVRIGETIFGVHAGNPELFLEFPTQAQAPGPALNALDAPFHRISWTSIQSPYCIFVPRDNPFYGPLLGRLRRPRNGFPLVRLEEQQEIMGGSGERGWIMDPDLRDSWRRLESLLRTVLKILLELGRVGAPEGMLPFLPERYNIWPTRHGYGHAAPVSTRRIAAEIVERSRNAFIPLMATISLMLFLLDSRGPSNWRDRVLDQLNSENIEYQVFADVENCAIGDRNIPRVGGILDFSNREDQNVNRRLQQHKLELLVELIHRDNLPIPLYFHWGEIKDVPDYPFPRHLRSVGFYPDWQEIRYLGGLPGKVSFSPWREERNGIMYSERDTRPYIPRAIPEYSPISTRDPPPPTSDDHPPSRHTPIPPQLEKHGGQRDASFSGHDPLPPATSDDPTRSPNAPVPPQPEKHSGQLYGEDIHKFVARRRARNEQLAAVETAKMKAERLQREENAAKGAPPGKKGARVFVWEEDNGFLIRRSVNRSLAADMWDEFTNNQRLYDGFSNEWDLCEALAPEEEPQDDYDSDGGCCHMDAFPEPSGVSTELLPEESIGPLPTSEDIMRSHGVDFEQGEIYGEPPPYHPDYAIADIPSARFGFTKPIAPAIYPAPLDVKLCLKSLGDEKWTKLGHTQYQHLPSFLSLLTPSATIKDIPQELLDLRQPGADVSSMSNWAVAVTLERLNSNLFYVLRPKGIGMDRIHILLPSAASTLQVVRMGWGPDPQEIILHLLKHGIQFRVCIRDSLGTEPRLPLTDGCTGLGYRRVGYKPTVTDFEVYEMLRRRFLLSPRGRAALFAGGIVGRLAREDIRDTRACLGPSSEVFVTGVRLWDGHSSMAYWDDALTDDEIDLICGVYEIGTGRKRKVDEAMQTTRVSWWPKPNAFDSSGMNIGWWSPDCEHWFQQRLAQIKSGQALLNKQADWKRFIRFYQKTRQVAESNEKIAAEFLKTRSTM